ncbi:hypothetical protein CTM97_18760 [Photobacterium phosphoreum]|uniref:Uncharacterized protein n=1 Tax=Photobacterium phosphoreum TaxID=659 RepID=A0A2T3JTE7_PHOPO|nr:hypothetical protein [Photobacterium phosphoreum]PSU19798.1 hypothetical protein CTM96_20605 [Photobacterium phosphoreum]PSU38631.1 hypothetical protein CTM97_18760 [Photobacterium phosphoreum]PSU52443.1 hypothetical protein C9J18_09900 [Photobacterium phosphoreum]
MLNTYLIVNKTRHTTGDLVNLGFCAPISLDTKSGDLIEFSEDSMKYLSLPSFDVRDSEVEFYVRAFSKELHALLTNFAINDNGIIACNNIVHFFKDQNARILPTINKHAFNAKLIAPTIVSKMTDSCKVFRYNKKPNNGFVVFSFSDHDQDDSLISIIDSGLSPFRRVNHDGFAVFKNNSMIHSTIAQLSMHELSIVDNDSISSIRASIGSLDALALSPINF